MIHLVNSPIRKRLTSAVADRMMPPQELAFEQMKCSDIMLGNDDHDRLTLAKSLATAARGVYWDVMWLIPELIELVESCATIPIFY